MIKKAQLCLILAFCATSATAGKVELNGFARVPVDCVGTKSEYLVFAQFRPETGKGVPLRWTAHYYVGPPEDGPCELQGVGLWEGVDIGPDNEDADMDLCHLWLGIVAPTDAHNEVDVPHYQTPKWTARIHENGTARMTCTMVPDSTDPRYVDCTGACHTTP